MARFTFPVPGRKKQNAAPANQPPTSKAQKVLGSTTLNLDAHKRWDESSTSGISVTVTDAHSPSHDTDIYRREWGDESDILPRRFDDTYSENTTALREQQSSSTIRSWYDRAKQPLSISQQTSASAMAQGLPSKAQRMLDVDNSLAPHKNKKKPAHLDLSSLSLSSRRSERWDGPILGPDMVTTSPSVLSQLSSSSSGRRLQKRPTKESLRQTPVISEPIRPGTGSSGRRYTNHPNGVPDLYGHYEQMSLRQIMDLESNKAEAAAFDESQLQPSLPQSPPSITRTSPPHRQHHLGHHQTGSQSTQSSKPAPQSSSESVSSRHTRTSRASKRTDSSFQDTDLTGKSVLSLSSDSEDDDYIATSNHSPRPIPQRTPSDVEQHAASLRSNGSRSAPDSRPKSGKRASFAPFHTYLPVPGHTPSPVKADSQSPSPTPPILLSPPPRSTSAVSSSSASSEATWQSSQPGFGIQEARAVTLVPASGPQDMASSEEQFSHSISSSEEQFTHSNSISSSEEQFTQSNSISSAADQPTPPLSPSSVDFYIRSAHSSIDGPSGGQNRFMAVSRQEELLLAALRQKRQLMRESFIAEEVSARLGRHSRKSSRGHKSKTSEATITQDLFDFDFPTPPKAQQEDDSLDSILAHSHEPDAATEGEEWPISPRTILDTQKLRQMLDMDQQSVKSVDSDQQILRPRCYSGPRRRSSGTLPPRHKPRPSVVPEETGVEVGRPDSPIAPEDFPAIPTRKSRNMARLSAVGNGRLGGGWWDDDG